MTSSKRKHNNTAGSTNDARVADAHRRLKALQQQLRYARTVQQQAELRRLMFAILHDLGRAR
jgi:hypothetical protein